MWENLLVVTGSNPPSVLMIFLPNLLLILLFPSTYFCVMRIRNLYKHNYSKLLQISNNRKQKNTCAAGNTDVADVYIKMLLAVWYLAFRNVGSRHRIVERQDLRKNVCLLTCLFVPLKNDHGAITGDVCQRLTNVYFHVEPMVLHDPF